MSKQQKPLILADLSWPEVRAIQDEVEMVLIPVGSNEQHGPNLSLSMDIKGATHFCNRVSELAYPRMLVAPSMPWGVSYHHMNFPGTITLSSATFIQTLVEVVDSLQQHGFTRFFIVNGHGAAVVQRRFFSHYRTHATGIAIRDEPGFSRSILAFHVQPGIRLV